MNKHLFFGNDYFRIIFREEVFFIEKNRDFSCIYHMGSVRGPYDFR